MTAETAPILAASTHDAQTLDRAQLIFLPYQLRWIRDRSMLRLGEKSRQIGWTWMNAGEDALNGVGTDKHPDVYFMATDQDAARSYVEDVQAWCENLRGTVDAFDEDWFDPKSELTFKIHCVQFPNGSKLEATTSNPRRLRGRRGNVKLDEFAFHDDPRELLRAAMPATTWGFTASIWSTHNGEGSVFNKLCAMAERHANGTASKRDMPWSHHHVNVEQACDDGLVERINEVTGRTLSRNEFIEQCRQRCLTEDDFMQEYMCQPCSESSAWLTYDLIGSCTSTEAPMPTGDLALFLAQIANAAPNTEAIALGADIGRTHDRFVIWANAKYGTRWETIGVLVWQGEKFARMQHAIEKTIAACGSKLRRIAIDATGLGMQLAEWAEDTYRHKAEGVGFTASTKEDMATRTRRFFDDRLITVPDDLDVREDLHSIRKEVTAAGNIRFAGERTKSGHADRFWALALALLAGDSGPARGRIITVTGGDF